MSKISIIILNYKVKDDTLKCIRSVINTHYKNKEIIVVDNNSEDGLADDLKKLSDIIFIQNPQNLGYSGGNNVGIKYALSQGADYIFIVNPDTTLDPDCINRCLETIDSHSAGVVGPKILFEDKKTIWYAGGTLDLNNVLGFHKGVDEEDHGQYNQIQETDYVSGAAMFVRKEVFDKIGLFDENYFLYYEDADFCFRAKQAGYKIVYAPKAVVYHKNAQSTGLGSPLQDYYITRNRLLFASKYLSLRTRFALLREAVGSIKIASRRKALIDFLLGKYGKGGVS